jgi:Na+/glutamate symporter
MLRSVLAFKNIFALFLTLCFAYGVWEARNYAYLAKVFPYYISMGLVILSIINLVQEIRASLQQVEQGKSSFADLSTNWRIPIELVWRRFFIYITMIFLLYGVIWLIGYPLALTVFIIIFYRFFAGASWWASAIAGAAGLGFLALASTLLNMDWPQGLLHLPWPLG